jgi:DNA-binding NarL/FixJ family response regulator
MSNIRVSIVEDDSGTAQILARWFQESEGFECLGQHVSAEIALTQLPLEQPDIVLMDINLRVMTGVECVRLLAPSLPRTQFIMLTVYEDSNYILNALAAGAIGYLLKQTPCDELLAALRIVQAGGSYMTGSIARKVVQHFQGRKPRATPESGLTARERQVLELLARGYLYKEISETLQICVPTVNSHIRHIYDKMHVQSRGQAVAKYANLMGEAKRQ